MSKKLIDSPQRVQHCLSCPYPVDCCLGEEKCDAERRAAGMENVRIWNTVIRYGLKHGMRIVEICREAEIPEWYWRVHKQEFLKGEIA